MPKDRTEPSDLPAELLEWQQVVRPLRPEELPQTLAAKLTPVVDRIRQLRTKFGVQQYRVFLVHVQWTGLRRGMGEGQEVSRVEILPTPTVSDLQGVQEIARALGRTEEGGVSVTEISARYSEDDLRGFTPDLVDPEQPRTLRPNVEFYWEVVEARANRPDPVRRRFTLAAAPSLSRDTTQWRVQLTRMDYDRSRSGATRGSP